MAEDLLFHQDLAEPHVDGALDLALDEERVDGRAAVVGDPHVLDPDVARLPIDLDFHRARGVGVGGRRPHAGALELGRPLGRGVGARGGKRAVGGLGEPGRLVEGETARRVVAEEHPAVPRLELGRGDPELLGRRVEEKTPELLGRLLGRVSRHQGDARGVGAEVDGGEVGVGSDDPDVLRADPEDLGDHVGEDGVGPLADVDRAAEGGHAATPVDLDHDAGVRHVVPVDGQARPREIRGRREADPPPGWELPGLLPPSRRRHHPVDALTEAGGRDREVVDRLAVGRHGVAMAHLGGVEAEALGDPVQVDLEGKAGLGSPVTALRPAGRLVREDAAALELVPRDGIGHGLERARVEGRGHPVGTIRPAVEERPELEGGDLTVLLHARLDPHQDGMSAPVRVKDLLPGQGRLHRPARQLGQARHHHLVAERIGLPAEPAAVRGRHDPDVARRELEHLGERPVDVVGCLRRGPEAELAVRRPLGDGGMLLHGKVGVALEEEDVFPDEVGRAEALLHVAELEGDQLVDVVAVPVVVDPRTPLGERGVDRHERGERLVLHLDEVHRRLRRLLVDGRDGRHGVPDEADLLDAEGLLVLAHRHDAEADRREVLARDHGVDAGERGGATRVDPPDQRVRVRGAEDLGVGHPGKHQVVGEAGLAGDLGPRVDLGPGLPDDGEQRLAGLAHRARPEAPVIERRPWPPGGRRPAPPRRGSWCSPCTGRGSRPARPGWSRGSAATPGRGGPWR